MFRQLDETVLVSGQIAPGDVAGAASAGISLIVNNRPDGEVPGQPTGSEIAAAADEVGIGYRHIPVAGGLSPELVNELSAALAAAEGKVLMFCGSGTRSAYLWALARAQSGVEPAEIIANGASAGYDLSSLAPYLETLKVQGPR